MLSIRFRDCYTRGKLCPCRCQDKLHLFVCQIWARNSIRASLDVNSGGGIHVDMSLDYAHTKPGLGVGEVRGEWNSHVLAWGVVAVISHAIWEECLFGFIGGECGAEELRCSSRAWKLVDIHSSMGPHTPYFLNYTPLRVYYNCFPYIDSRHIVVS